MNLLIKGRGKLCAETLSDWSGVTIRVDDDAAPEFWAEIRISPADLRLLLEELDRVKAERNQSERAASAGSSEGKAEVTRKGDKFRTRIPEYVCRCKTEGPPGPVWCSVCGHDPRCCTCDGVPTTEGDLFSNWTGHEAAD